MHSARAASSLFNGYIWVMHPVDTSLPRFIDKPARLLYTATKSKTLRKKKHTHSYGEAKRYEKKNRAKKNSGDDEASISKATRKHTYTS